MSRLFPRCQVSYNNQFGSPFVGSLPYFSNPVALFPDESGNVGKVIPIIPEAVAWTELGNFKDDFYRKGYLNYDEVREYIYLNPEIINPELSGGYKSSNINESSETNKSLLLIIGIITFFIIFISIFLVLRLKNVNKQSKTTSNH